MRELAPGLFLLGGAPRYAINVYLLDGVVIDAATRFARRRILRQLRGQTVSAHALTHAHPDHQGASRAVCRALGIPLWCGEGDVAAAESGDLRSVMPRHWFNTMQQLVWAGPGQPVERRLREGDHVGSFTVLETPGHSPGHVVFWRQRDRTLVLGDVLNGMNLLTGAAGLHEPPELFTVDPPLNRQSILRLAELKPALLCFGHGPPLCAAGEIEAFVERMLAKAPVVAPAASPP